jgi:ribonuclease P protein component
MRAPVARDPARFGLPKRARLRARGDFERASRGAPFGVSAHFKVVRGRGAGGGARLGLVVPAKVGGAVARNRVKRLVREWFRQARPALPPGLEVVVIARPGADRLALPTLAQEIEGALGRAGRGRSS